MTCLTMPKPIKHWLDEYYEKLNRGLLGKPLAEANEETIETYPEQWPKRFIRVAHSIGLSRYLDVLADLETGKRKPTPYHRRTMLLWANRIAPGESLILFGGEGTGKSVAALRISLTASQRGMTWDFVDAGEFADFWAKQDYERINYLKQCDVLVIDEIGDCEDIKGAAFGLMKRVINYRYRNARPTVLATTQNEYDLRDTIGHEIVDRFRLQIASNGKSQRRLK